MGTIKSRARPILTEKRKGFAITVEMLFTITIFAMFVNATLFSIYVMHLQNTIYSIGANATAEISRWGGTNTNSYRINSYTNGYGDIVSRTNNELRHLTGEKHIGLTSAVNAHVVSAGPSKITRVGEDTWMTISFTYPLPITVGGDFLRTSLSRTRVIKFRVPSITHPGSLL